MKTKLHLIILCLLLFLAGGGSVIHAADSWSYPTTNLTASLAAALAAITTLILSTMPNSLPTWRIWSIMANTSKASISS